MEKPKLFVTHDLQKLDFDFYKDHFEVHGKSLISICPIDFSRPIPNSDWIFFYSKNGVEHFFNQVNPEEFELISKRKIGTIGASTAAFLVSTTGLSPSFVYDGNDIESLKIILSGSTILIPQGSNSRKTLEHHLNYENTIPLVVYKNEPIQSFSMNFIPDIVILTSPMNADAYLINNTIDENSAIITLGETTSNHLLEKYGLTSKHGQQSSIKTAFELALNN